MSMHCGRSSSSLPPSDFAYPSATVDISSDPLGSPRPNPRFRPYREANHDGYLSQNNLDIGSTPHIEAATVPSGLQSRKRACQSLDSEGAEGPTFIDGDLVQGERDRSVMSPLKFGPGRSVFVPEGKQQPISLSCFASPFTSSLEYPPTLHSTTSFGGFCCWLLLRLVMLSELEACRVAEPGSLPTMSVDARTVIGRSGACSVPGPVLVPLHVGQFLTWCSLPVFAMQVYLRRRLEFPGSMTWIWKMEHNATIEKLTVMTDGRFTKLLSPEVAVMIVTSSASPKR